MMSSTKIILTALPLMAILIALYMVIGAPMGVGCLEIEMPVGGSIKRCEEEGRSLSTSQISELEQKQQEINTLKIKELEENKQQLSETSNNNEIIDELDREITSIKQQETNFQYLQESDYETFIQEAEQIQKEVEEISNVSINDVKNLKLEGKWKVTGFFKDRGDQIQYDGVFTFNPDGTFTENNSVGAEMYGSGTYDLQTLGDPRLFLKKAKLDFGFYQISAVGSNYFNIIEPFGWTDLKFTK